MRNSLRAYHSSVETARSTGSICAGLGIVSSLNTVLAATRTGSIHRPSTVALPSILDAAHSFAGQAIRSGDLVIDATVGNGHDTLFLLREVGAEGRVVGFDIQADALDATRQRVQRQAPEQAERLRLVHDGHEAMTAHLGEQAAGTVGAIMFNLGYLPGGDHAITTNPETTRSALSQGLDLLRPGGVMTIVAYSGHPGGEEEAQAVESWAASLPQDPYRALSYRFVNQRNDPPRLFAVEKRDSSRNGDT